MYHSQRTKISSVCWLDPPFSQTGSKNFMEYDNLRNDDALYCFFAFSGESKIIEIVNVTEQKITKQLKGHESSVIALAQPHSTSEGFTDLLVSCSSSGEIFLWHWPSSCRLYSIQRSCISLVSIWIWSLVKGLLY